MTLVNRFAIALDASGSMASLRKNVVDTFNSNAKAIRDGAFKAGQQSSVTLVTFGERNPLDGTEVCEKVFDAKLDISMRLEDYQTNGMTPMYDGIGRIIERLKALPDGPEVSNLVLVITDGAENASTKYGNHSLRELMASVNRTDRWSFVFLVPPGGRHALLGLGIHEGNIQEWTQTAEGVKKAQAQIEAGVNNFYTSRASGQRSTKGFFTTDASKIKAADVKAAARNIRTDVTIWEVPAEVEIRSFVESHGVPYMRGKAFYQLTKKETIQQDKELLLIEKGKTAVYQGDSVRSMLGLPTWGDAEVKPGNHANWDIFVQSTSTNRKLVRGTKLVYCK